MQVLESHIVQHIAFIPWQQTISVLEMIVKGFIIGIVVSAPMGPTGVLCVQRTMNKGRAYGLATGLGASLSDIIYALITGYGMSFVMDIIENPQVLFWVKMVGSALLLMFGVFTFNSNPVKEIRHVSHNKGSLIHNFVTGFIVTVSNPAIIFLFLALFGQFLFIVPGRLVHQVVGYLALICGAVAWWFGLTYLVDKVRNRFEERGLWVINRVIGIVVILVSIGILLYSLKEWLEFPSFGSFGMGQ